MVLDANMMCVCFISTSHVSANHDQTSNCSHITFFQEVTLLFTKTSTQYLHSACELVSKIHF